MDAFYVTLPSDGDDAGFPDNTNVAFRTRMRPPLWLRGGRWVVGVVRLSVPDDDDTEDESWQDTLLRVYPRGALLAYFFSFEEDAQRIDRPGIRAETRIEDVAGRCHDGASFVKAVVDDLRRKYWNKVQVGWNWKEGDKTFVPEFRWPDPDTLVIDNSRVVRDGDIGLSVHQDLMRRMGGTDAQGNVPGPRLTLRPTVNPVTLEKDWAGQTLPAWEIVGNHVILYQQYSWELSGLNDGWFETLFERRRRPRRTSRPTWYVHSNVGQSRRVGTRSTDVLCDVDGQSTGRGRTLFEPRHVQYVPVRQFFFDTVDVRLTDGDGRPAAVGRGVTVVTLHFQRSDL